MSKNMQYKIELPLFTDEATSIWKDMQNVIKGVVEKKKEAIDKFNKLDTLVNGGELKSIGTVFGQRIYARFAEEPEMAEYHSKRLSALMSNFIRGETEEIVLGGKRYIVLLKEEL